MAPSSEARPREASAAVGSRPDAFISYAREDKDFVERRLSPALLARGKDVWIDVQDIRSGASDWRASVWAGIESAKVMVFVLSPDSLASRVCGEELGRAVELNKRLIPVLCRPVDDVAVPPALARPNWILARADDDFDEGVAELVAALELDEAWVNQHARFTQRTAEWLRHDRDRSYLLRGSDLRAAERWLDDQGAHHEAPTSDQVAYIIAGRRAAARRQRALLAGAGLALAVTTALAIIALVQRSVAVDREQTARAQARAAQAIAALSRDPEESLRRALEAVEIRPDEPEAMYALRRAVSAAGWTSMMRIAEPSGGLTAPALLDAEKFSHDGTRVAAAGEDGNVAVWDARTARQLARVAHPRSVTTVQFSPDDRQLLTASDDGTARSWDSSSGRPLRVFHTRSAKTPDGEVWAATWGAGGRLVATVSADGAQVWDAASGSRAAWLPNRGEYRGTIRLSPDGRRVITSGGGGGDAWLWSVNPRRRVATLPGDGRNPLRYALFSGDGRRICTLDGAGAVTVWATGGRRIARFPAAGGVVTDLDLSRAGRRVLAARADGTVDVWDVASRRRIARLRNGAAVRSAQFDRGGGYVVAGDDDGVARVWSVTGRRPVAVLRGHTALVRRARFAPGGTRVVTVSDDGSARLWPSRPRTPTDPRWQRADSATFGPDSRAVLVVNGRRRGIWDTVTGKVRSLSGGVFALDPAAWPCGHAAGCSPWSPDGRFVAGATAGGRAVVWDARTGAAQRSVGRASGSVIGAAFSSDGRRLVVVDGERPQAQIWSLPDDRLEAEVPARRSMGDVLQSAQFIADPPRVMTVDASGLAQVSGPETDTSAGLGGDVQPFTAAATADGRQVAIGTTDGLLRVFSGPSGTMRSRRASRRSIVSLTYDRTGTAIATGDQVGAAAVWDARTLAPRALRASGGEISGATFSRDGDLLLVTSESIARLWDPTLRRVVLELPRTPGVRAELSPDGSTIVIAGATRLEARRCDACAPVDELAGRARSLLPAP